jgi:hypothetical protein
VKLLKSSHIVILGTHPETLDAFDPARHADDEVWGMAHHAKTRLYATKAFEAHSPEIVWEHGGNGHVERLKTIASQMPLYTMYEWPMSLGRYHNTVTSDQLAKLGVVRNRPEPFIESSIGYILAMALAKWDNDFVSDISLYGINMDGSDEYTYQRPNVAYLIGKAEGLGINVHLPQACGLLSSQWTAGVYGHPKNIRDINYYLRPEGAPVDAG